MVETESTMEAFYYDKYGKASVDKVGSMKAPTEEDLKSGELLLEMFASSLNPIDYKQRKGLMKTLFSLPFPQVHGFDFAGRIKAKGDSVDDFEVGDMVFGLVKGVDKGCCSELKIVQASVCARLPEGISPVDAVSVALVGITTITAFQRGGLKEKDEEGASKRVLILGGAGGVGTVAIQLAKGLYQAGFVATTASPGTKTELCTKLGADLVVNYKEDPTFKALENEEPFDFIFDTVGSAKKAFPYVKEKGIVVSIAAAPTVEGLGPWLAEAKENLAFGTHTMFFTRPGKAMMNWGLGANKLRKQLKGKHAEYDFIGAKGSGEMMNLLKEEMEAGRLVAVIDKTYPLAEAKEAMAHLESGRAAGKVVVVVRND